VGPTTLSKAFLGAPKDFVSRSRDSARNFELGFLLPESVLFPVVTAALDDFYFSNKVSANFDFVFLFIKVLGIL
jgi:hypothetical protein